MKIFAAALNLAVFTSAIKITAQTEAIDKTTDGYKMGAKAAGAIFDSCKEDKNGPECIAMKLHSELKLPKDVAQSLQNQMKKADKEKRPLKELRGEFIDTLFGLYAFLNGGDPAGVAAGTAPFDLSKVTMADV